MPANTRSPIFRHDGVPAPRAAPTHASATIAAAPGVHRLGAGKAPGRSSATTASALGVDRHAERLDRQAGDELVDGVLNAARAAGPLRPAHDRAFAVDDDAGDAPVREIKTQ